MEATERQESALNASTEQGSASQVASKPRINPIERPTLERITSSAHQALDKIAQAANQAAETLDEKSRHVRESQVELAGNFRHYVKEHPGTSVGLAVATGFLIRHLLSLR